MTNDQWRNRMIAGDCLTVLREMPADLIDLIVTSPPYADSRKQTYGGIHPDRYVEWFLPIADELARVLKPEGTFILNIKEKALGGERDRKSTRLNSSHVSISYAV